MSKNGDTALQRQVNQALEAFRASLLELLTVEARQQVDEVVRGLDNKASLFRVEEVDVEVAIHGLKLVASGDGETAHRPASPPKRRKSSPSRGRSRSRATGNQGSSRVRETLLAAFPDNSTQFDVAALSAHLESKGVTTSAGNIHQQLRRLVLSGDLERTGRGIYKRTTREAA